MHVAIVDSECMDDTACNLFICCFYVGLVKTGSCSLQSVYMLLLCWVALYCICGCSLMLLDWGRLEDAGYAVGARVLELLFHQEKVNPHSHQLKLCDFGSAKMLVPGEPNMSYICSRYYRAPELIFGATEYTTAIDMWSAGCVLAELLLGQPLFPGESGVDQLVEIIKILGTPTREEIRCMNPNYTEFKFPQIKAHPWHKVFNKRMLAEAVDLVSRLLQYSPNLRCTALEACAHPFFDDLREPTTSLPNGRPLPPLFNFTPLELAGASPELRQHLIPEHVRK
ncbi:hypothetical protein ACSBR1_034862 [Camellia fascicularis]